MCCETMARGLFECPFFMVVGGRLSVLWHDDGGLFACVVGQYWRTVCCPVG